MTTYNIQLNPVSPGTKGGHGGISPGTGQYATTPSGPRDATVPMTDAHIQMIQGFLVVILAGTDTTTVTTAVANLGPT